MGTIGGPSPDTQVVDHCLYDRAPKTLLHYWLTLKVEPTDTSGKD